MLPGRAADIARMFIALAGDAPLETSCVDA
jgi:hypothetical protein